jgi:chemotaxis protein CheX
MKNPEPDQQSRFIQPPCSALINVLSTMAGTEINQCGHTYKSSRRARGSISGIIPFAGDNHNGSLAITFSKGAILAIYRQMLCEECSSITSETANLAGEITNIVAAGANRVYSEQGDEFSMATPRVLTGPSHAIHHQIDAPTILIPFESMVGNLFIELCFAANPAWSDPAN